VAEKRLRTTDLVVLTKYENIYDKTTASVCACSHFNLYRNRAERAFQGGMITNDVAQSVNHNRSNLGPFIIKLLPSPLYVPTRRGNWIKRLRNCVLSVFTQLMSLFLHVLNREWRCTKKSKGESRNWARSKDAAALVYTSWRLKECACRKCNANMRVV